MDIDRDHAEFGQRSSRRLAIPHEWCQVLGYCSGDSPMFMDVLVVGDDPGVRLRAPADDQGAAA
jgi:hypothetical protein